MVIAVDGGKVPRSSRGVRGSWQRGLTLIELLVVIAVAAVLIGLLFSGYQVVMSGVGKARCAANLRQIGQYIHLYGADHDGDLVPTLKRGEGTTSGATWVQIMHSAGTFELGPPRGPSNFPSWHLNSNGMFTCPSLQTRQDGMANHRRKRNLSNRLAAYGAHFYDGIHYGMLGTIGGINNRRNHDWPALKINQFANPSTTMIVGETDYRYLFYPNNATFRASPHDGSFYLNLDGSVAFWEGELPSHAAASLHAPPFWDERAQ